MSRTVPEGVVAVIRTESPSAASVIARGLADAGLGAIEITFTVPGAAAIISSLVGSTHTPVGAGTVRTVEQCEAAARAGAAFVVSPDFNADVVACAHHHGLAAIPGALSPAEVGRCIDAGADAVKVFPIGAVGGPAYIRDLAGPFPGVSWVASGGITPADVPGYRAAGCATVCLGRALIDPAAVTAADENAIGAYARRVLAEAL